MTAAPAAGTAGRGGRLTLPVDTPYERQLLRQCVRTAVARWGAARIVVGRREMLVVGASAAARCRACGGAAGGLECRGAGIPRCLLCALAAALPDGSAMVTITTEWPGARHALRPAPSGRHSRRVDAARPPSAQHRQ